MAEHDSGYKLLFSHREMVEDLLRGFLDADWIQDLDFSTLERVGDSYVSGRLRQLRGDLVWRLRWKDPGRGWFYLYFLLEFQSTPDPTMALRLSGYVSLLLAGLVRSGEVKIADGLPAVVPLVLYNGKRPWNVPLDLTSLFRAVPPGAEIYQPQLSYLLIDEKRLRPEELARPGSPVAALFQLETSTPTDLFSLAAELAVFLPPSDESDLRRDFGTWVAHLVRRLHPGAIIPETLMLEDIPMLEETLREWLQEGREEGRRAGQVEGRQAGQVEGRQAGQVEGMQQLLLQLLRQRFGTLPRRVRQQVEAISSAKRLKELAKQVLVADSLQAMGLG
ncbi:MAG TPA: Rpn family recombination-promoting nuclease/putative transposase [Thermoanaerobaculia bacterium]|nr:Rpn family recombination-promoting nuclease/putative transposase [Thermoanaerobaculia bacterium]